MPSAREILKGNRPNIVGSFGTSVSLKNTTLAEAKKCADFLEIRLDLLVAEGVRPERSLWAHVAEMPLLFTARRREEGSPVNLDAAQRAELIEIAIEDAAIIDIEVASIPEMARTIRMLKSREIPWIASYHDFERLPSHAALAAAAALAKQAGADVFKAAAKLSNPADISSLADFQLSEQGLRIATMGMGPLAPVSRLLCAQCASVLNYGYIGETPTAPGQWSAEFLKLAVSKLSCK